MSKEHWNGGTGGKGSRPRPYGISKDEFDQKFDSIFGEKRKYCDVCGKKFSWCQCVSASKELCDEIDKALGINHETD